MVYTVELIVTDRDGKWHTSRNVYQSESLDEADDFLAEAAIVLDRLAEAKVEG